MGAVSHKKVSISTHSFKLEAFRHSSCLCDLEKPKLRVTVMETCCTDRSSLANCNYSDRNLAYVKGPSLIRKLVAIQKLCKFKRMYNTIQLGLNGGWPEHQ
jgi:hypothetical protein